MCFPFGLPAQSIWLESVVKHDQVYLYEHVSQTIVDSSSLNETSLINFNPALNITQAQEIELIQTAENQCNVFTVYQSNPNYREGLIWSGYHGSKEALMLTDQRMVDLASAKFMNFLDQDLSTAKINVYHHYKQGLNINRLTLASRPQNAEIPVVNFQGGIAELLFFNKVLAPQAKQKLESSLALKYSTALTPGYDYLDEHGAVIWDTKNGDDYQNRISGLGRSTNLKLYQRQSSSPLGQGIISIGLHQIAKRNDLNHSEMNEGSYLLWADNNDAVSFDKIDRKTSILKRQWKVKNIRMNQSPLAFQCKHKGLEDDLKMGEHYWLFVSDYEYDFKNLEDVQLYQMDKYESAFEVQNIAMPETSESYFGIIKAPEFWAMTQVHQANCEADATGNIAIKPVGGQAPYQLKLYDKSDRLIEQVMIADQKVWNTQESFIERLR